MLVDRGLQQATEGRIASWNHDVLPEYLRTKFTQEMESEEQALDAEKITKSADMSLKQALAFLPHVIPCRSRR